jgi:hypothetical protein
LRWTKRAPLFSPQAAPVIAPTSSSISRFTGEADHLAEEVGVGGLLQQRLQVHHLVGHRESPVRVGVDNPDPTGKTR